MMSLIIAVVLFVLVSIPSAANAEEPNASQPSATNEWRAFFEGLIPPQELKEDLDFLFDKIAEIHPNMYAFTSEEEFAKIRDALYARIDKPMSRRDFYRHVSPVVASLKTGHTFVVPPFKQFKSCLGSEGEKTFPFKALCDGKNVIILLKDHGMDDLPTGGTIVSINDRDVGEVVSTIARWSGADGEDNRLAELERDLVLQTFLWVEFEAPAVLNVRVRDAKGEVASCKIEATSSEEPAATGQHQSKKPCSYRFIETDDTGVITMDSFWDMEESSEFFEKTFSHLRRKKIPNLIIDLRNCPGGSSTIGDVLLAYISDKPFLQMHRMDTKLSPEVYRRYGQDLKSCLGDRNVVEGRTVSLRFNERGDFFRQPVESARRYRGRVFVLINRGSFSSSSSFASAVKYYGMGVLVGEETGGPTACYGDCIMNSLPHSGIEFSTPCKYFVQAGGKDDGRGVMPDHEVRQSPEDLAKGVDTVLEYTLDLIRREKDPD